MPLPVSYQARLETVPGVELATHNTWFGGIYQDPANFFANIAVDPEAFLKVYPEYKLPPDFVVARTRKGLAFIEQQGPLLDARARSGRSRSRRTSRSGGRVGPPRSLDGEHAVARLGGGRPGFSVSL